MRKQCVLGASPFFARAGDEANFREKYYRVCIARAAVNESVRIPTLSTYSLQLQQILLHLELS